MGFYPEFCADTSGGEAMEDQVRKSQQTLMTNFRDWWDQWLQEMLGDEVIGEFWSAMEGE